MARRWRSRGSRQGKQVLSRGTLRCGAETLETRWVMAAPQAVGDSFSTLEGQTLRSSPGDYAQSVMASQPLAYWRLGEAAGDATAHDEMGRLDGHYILGSTPLAADPLQAEDNAARAFDGYMGRVFIEPDSNYTELTSSFSIEAWIYPTIGSYNHRVLATLGSDNNSGFGFGIAAQMLRLTLFGSQEFTLPTPGVPTNQWTHVAAVFDASFDVSFYINGAFVGKLQGDTPAKPSDARLVIGGFEGVGEQWWAGAIDEVALYSRTLSGGEIAAHHQAGLRTAAFNVLGNDSDADGNPLSAVLETPPQHGQLALQASGAFEYTPNPGYSGSDSFTYRASDGQELSAPATVNLTITPVDQPPNAQEDHYVLPAAGPLVVAPAAGVLANDLDAEGAALIAELIDGPAHGTLTFNANGGFQYQPGAGAFAVDQFTYRAFDGQGRSAVTTVHLAAANLSAGTIARDDRYSLWATNSLTVGLAQSVLANDVEFQGDALAARLVGLPAHGVVHLNADGTFTYVPADGFTGVDTFLYRATDGVHESNLGTVSIEVTALPFQVIEWPVAEGGNGHFYGLNQEQLQWVLARDKAVTMAYRNSPGELTSITSAAEQAWFESHFSQVAFLGGYQDETSPSYSEPGGAWTWSSGEPWSYTHWNPGEPNDAGDEGFLVGPRWNDERSGPSGSWYIEFGPPPAPTAWLADDAYRMLVGQSVAKTAAAGLLANDLRTPAGAAVELVAGPAHGQLTLNADGSFTYTPAAGYQGRDAFRYRTTGAGAAANEGTVWLSVGVNETIPLAVDDAYFADEDATFVLGPSPDVTVGLVSRWTFDEAEGNVAHDPQGGNDATLHNWTAGEPKWVAGRIGGALSISDGDDYLITEGIDSRAEYTFTFWARRDREGGLNPRLLASTDKQWDILAYLERGKGIGSDLVYGDQPPTIGVWEHYAVTFVAATGDTQVFRDGALVASGVSRSAPQLTGQWVIGHSSYLDFTDDTWRGAIDDLRIYDRRLTSNEIGAIVLQDASLLGNDSDLDGDPLSVELVQNVAHGALSLSADGTFSYTPTPDYIGTDSFTYRVSDGSAWSNVATVTLTVRNQPDPTTTVDDAYALDEDVPLSVGAAQGVLANDQDLDGLPVGATVVTNVAHGSLDLRADGSFVYTPTKDYYGADQFTYKVVDAAGESNVATVALTVRPKNDAPVARSDAYSTSQVGVVQASVLRGVLANDSDPEGDALTATVVQTPTHGTLAFNADGSFLYTPAAGYVGQDKFTYRASDGQAQSSVATVTLTVRQATVDVALRAVANPSAADTAAALPASLATVDVGSEYYVEIWIQDVGAAPAGLPGGQLDLDFDTVRSNALALGHGGLYNLIPTGTIAEAAGHIDDFGGGTINPAASAAPQWARLGYLRVSASAHGVASYQLGPGALQFSRVGGGSVPWEQVDLSETLLVDHQAAAELEVRVVAQPTAVDAAGEVDGLPTSLPWVDEWSGYWVEVWVRSADEGAGQGISQAAANLLYDTRYGTAREIQYGPGFTMARTGAIDDSAGHVTNLGAATTRSDVGDDRFALLARVRFAPGVSDQAPVDEAEHVIGPYDLALGLSDPAVRLVGAAANGPTDLRAAKLPIYAAFYDIDDNDQIDYGDLSYFAAAFGKTDAGAGEPPYVWWANFDRQGATVDFGDFSYLAANFGRRKEQGGLSYPANYPAAWTPLSAAALVAAPLDEPARPLGGDVGMTVRLVARATPSASDNAAALPVGLTQVVVGGTYTIEVWVQDAAGVGVTGGLVDLSYPQGRVDAGELHHGGVYTTFAQGTLREPLGRADDLGGGSVAAALGATPQWVRLGFLTVQVTGAGPLEFKLSPGQLQFSRYGEGNVAWDAVNLGTLTLNPALMGDVNSDHAVDLTDFGIFKANFGTGTTWAQGDLDGNGRIDLGDFGRFKENFGRTAAAVVVAIPPPAAARTLPSSDESHAAAVDLAVAMAGEDEAEELPWSFAWE